MTKWRNGEMVLKIRAKLIRYNHSDKINISYYTFCCLVSLSSAVFRRARRASQNMNNEFRGYLFKGNVTEVYEAERNWRGKSS